MSLLASVRNITRTKISSHAVLGKPLNLDYYEICQINVSAIINYIIHGNLGLGRGGLHDLPLLIKQYALSCLFCLSLCLVTFHLSSRYRDWVCLLLSLLEP